MKAKGFTLIETVLYIGLIMILLPSIVLMLLEVQKNQAHTYSRMLIEQTSAILLSEFENELLDAYSIVSSSSTLNSDQSILVFKKVDGGLNYELSFETDVVVIGDIQHNIGRINFFDGFNYWLTPEQINVTVFRIEPARNSDGELTGLNIELELSPLAILSDEDVANILNTQTTLYLFPTVSEQ